MAVMLRVTDSVSCFTSALNVILSFYPLLSDYYTFDNLQVFSGALLAMNISRGHGLMCNVQQ
jgi:hypothetical protein